MRVVEHVLIQADLRDVWRVLADVESWPSWTPTVLRVELLGPPGMGAALKVGSRYRVTQPKLRPAIYQVTAYEPPQSFTWAAKLPGGVFLAEHHLSPSGGAVEAELSFSTQGALGNLLGRMYAGLINEYVATESRSLKAYCEKNSGTREELSSRGMDALG